MQRQAVPDQHPAGPALDVADETYVAVPPTALAPVVADPTSWTRWWPDLEVTVTRDRGVKGQQWAVGGPVTGSMEVWLEPVGEGTVVHWFLRADPVVPRHLRRLRADRERRVLAWKSVMFDLKDRLEGVKIAAPRADQP